MSNHDSHQNDNLPEFADLEARMRQSRPQITPMSPAAKRRLRAQLLEDTRMNEPKLTIGRLVTALSALILVVGLPLYFWAIQSSLSNGAASQPAGIAAQATETATPVPTATGTVLSPVPTEAEYNSEIVFATPTPLPTLTIVPIVEPTVNVSVVTVGDPVEMGTTDGGPPPGTFYTVPVEVSYSLLGYEEALLFIDYKLEDANGAAGGSHVTLITPAGEGRVTAELGLSNTFLMADGRISPDIEFDVHINAYDAETEQYVNIFPGGLELSPDEQNMPYPYHDLATQDYLALNAVSFNNIKVDEADMTLSLTAVLKSDVEGEITAVISSNNTEIASKTITVTQESDLVNLSLPLTNLSGDELFDVTVTLNVGDAKVEVIDAVPLAELTAAEPNSVWLIEMNAEPNGESVFFTAVVGYLITDPYTAGAIEHQSSYILPGGNGGSGGGGGGGGGRNLPAGVGVTTIRFGMGGEGMTVDNWQDFMTMEIRLNGITADGSQELLDTVVLSPDSE